MTAAPLNTATAEAAVPFPLTPPEYPILTFEGGDRALTDQLLAPLRGGGSLWWALLGVSGAGTALFVFCIWYTFAKGIGTWGNNIPVAWAFAITDFVWWIGIGHAGTFISAFLLLLHQRWRASINRIAEAMTIFAVMCAGMFPLLHMGRPWLFYYLLPYPNPMWLWPQFRSPLVWDVFAVFTYFTVALLFWYVGLIPYLATQRDLAKTKATKIIYGILSIVWRG